MTEVEEQGRQEQLAAVFEQYDGTGSDLIPILQDVQDVIGYLPRDAMEAVADFLNLTESAVYGVATFYAQFYLTRQGKHKIRVCQGTACHVRGAPRIIQAIRDRIGIGPGETSDGYTFSLERVACFGSCALAPVMVVDDDVYGNVTPDKALKILEGLS